MGDELPKGRIAVTGTFTAKFNSTELQRFYEDAFRRDAERIAFLERVSGMKVVLMDPEA